MNKGYIILTLTLILIVGSAVWAQDQQPAPASPPIPGAGRERRPNREREPADFRDRPAGTRTPCCPRKLPVTGPAFQ